MKLRSAFLCLLPLLVLPPPLDSQLSTPGVGPYTFKGNYLGMSLADFRAANNQGQVAIAWGQPNWRGKPKRGRERMVPTPLCTD